jgi:hypothetical protein
VTRAFEVLDALAAGTFSAPAHVMLREVRDGTGAQACRSADGLVVSCWPSRGIWIGGIEVKVDRRDWRNELKNPRKSASIQKFCSYWWIATPPGIVEPAELPETWGHIEVTGKVCKVLKAAPKLEASELTPTFVASVLRNASSEFDGKLRAEFVRGKEEAKESLKDLASPLVQNELTSLKLRLENANRESEALRTNVETFERETGLTLKYHWALDRTIAAIKTAVRLEAANLTGMANSLEMAVAALREASGTAPLAPKRKSKGAVT